MPESEALQNRNLQKKGDDRKEMSLQVATGKRMGRALRKMVGYNLDDVLNVEDRNADSSLLMNSARQDIFEYVFSHPMTHLRLMARGLEAKPQTINWHLPLLVKGGFLEGRRMRNKHCYLVPTLIPARGMKAFFSLNCPGQRSFYSSIRKDPGISQRALCSKHGVYQQLGANWLNELSNSKLVVKTLDGRTNSYSISPLLKELVEEVEDRMPELANSLMEKLVTDGVAPKRVSRRGLNLRIQISNGPNQRVLSLNLRSPLLRNIV